MHVWIFEYAAMPKSICFQSSLKSNLQSELLVRSQNWVPYKSWWHAIEGMNSTAHYKSDGACWITVKFTVIWIWKLLVVESFRNLSLKISSKQWLKSTTTNSIYYTTVVSYTSNTRPISVTHTHHKGKHYDNDAFEHIVYVELESW